MSNGASFDGADVMEVTYRNGNCVAQLIQLDEHRWLLTHIGVPNMSGWRGHGDGERTLSRLCQLADADSETLVLSIQPDPDMDRERLIRWYLRHGFDFIPEDPDRNSMIRLPQGDSRVHVPQT